LGGSFAVDWVATFLWIGWQKSVEYAVAPKLNDCEAADPLSHVGKAEPQQPQWRGWWGASGVRTHGMRSRDGM
jgi:hypothetical protein